MNRDTSIEHITDKSEAFNVQKQVYWTFIKCLPYEAQKTHYTEV